MWTSSLGDTKCLFSTFLALSLSSISSFPFASSSLHSSPQLSNFFWHPTILSFNHSPISRPLTKPQQLVYTSSAIMKLLPYWLSMPNDHWQIVVRCSVAAWCCMLTCLVHSSLELNGLAAFLAVIFVMVSPPSTPLIVFTYHSLVGGLIVVTTWAWCVAGMKASVGLRSSERDRTTEGTALYAAGISYSNGTLLPGVSDAQALAIIQAAVYDGNFLQARSSAIWGAFLFIGVFPIWILRAYRAKYFAVMVRSLVPQSSQPGLRLLTYLASPGFLLDPSFDICYYISPPSTF